MEPRQALNLRMAFDVLTAYEDSRVTGDSQFLDDELSRLGTDTDPAVPLHLVAGLVMLGHYLAEDAAEHTGETLDQVLRRVGDRITGDTT